MNPIEMMLAELESNQLEVCLVPQKRFTNECGMIRVAVSKNCTWYRRFCAKYPSSRVRNNSCFDTRIKRRDTIRSLNRMLAGGWGGKYETDFREIAAKLEKKAG